MMNNHTSSAAQPLIFVQHDAAASAPPPLNARAALFLDFDGTLAAIAPRPDLVHVDDALRDLLQRLSQRLDGALAIISGRPLDQIDALLAPLRLPAAGVHGAQQRADLSQPARLLKAQGLQPALNALHALFDGDERLLIEDKGAGAALHFRLAPERGLECVDAMHRVAASCGLELLVGHQVVEARMPGCNKGEVVRQWMQQAPFAGRVPIAIGDDRTDEDAFAAAVEAGGYGIKVGGGLSHAAYRLAQVEDVHAWLRAALAV